MTIPNKELVGKNPKLEDGVYTDDYMNALNEFARVDEVFRESKAAIASGENIVGRLVMDTLGKSEYENHLVAIVMSAAEAGEWRAVVRESEKHIPGLDTVTRKHFGHVTAYQGKTFLLPSVSYVVYCNDRI